MRTNDRQQTSNDCKKPTYADFDILSFSESWLNRSHTDESLKLSNYQIPFRKDRGPNKSGGGVILYVKDNIALIL